MQSELKPCPFCGADFKMGQEPQDNHPVAGQFYLYHNYGPLGSVARLCPLSINRHFYTEVEAIAAWNTRASDAEITRLTEALRLQMEAKHKEAAEAKLWFQKAQEWKEALRAAEEREAVLMAGLDRIAHRDPWTDPDSPERIARDTLAGAKP